MEVAYRAGVEGGVGASASRLVSGNFELAEVLEQELAGFHGAPAACLFNSGYAANTGTLPVLAGPGDVIFSDELNHASIIDGCRLSRAEVVVYRHADLDDLSNKLAEHRSRRRVVVTESVFSMDGDLAPLGSLRSLANEYSAILVVDDAHAVGCLGTDGTGLGFAAGADVVIGTLGKAFGVSGAYVLGPAGLRELLWNRARSLVFSTGLTVPVLAAALASVNLARGAEGVARRSRLGQHMAYTAKVLGRSVQSPIIPFLVGDDRRVMEFTEWLADRGFFVQGIRPPTVPEGTARLRLTLSSVHSEGQLSGLLGFVAEWMGMEDARTRSSPGVSECST
jgi:8-amino-7-oxononanoate synthase